MQNTDQNDSPPSLNPETPASSPPLNSESRSPKPSEHSLNSEAKAAQAWEAGKTGKTENREISEFPHAPRNSDLSDDDFADTVKGISGMNESTNAEMVEAMGESINEATFVEVNGGSSGQLRTPEEAAEARKKALESVRNRVEGALQRFGKVTKQSHIVDRLLVCLTPTASMPDRLPFTPVASLHLASRNRDDHILHLAGLIIESWGIFMRYGEGGMGSIDELQVSVTLLEDIVQDRRLFKVYPVNPRSSLFTLRRVTDQVKLDEEARALQAERDALLSDFPTQ